MAVFISQKKLEAEIAQRTAEACEQIISEMGAELHDELIQKLAVFRLYIDRTERTLMQLGTSDDLSIKMRSEFDQVIHAVRSISRRLLPSSMDDETLVQMIEMLCQNMESPGTGHIHFESNGTAVTLPAQTERYLFRIVQELVHNAFKHSSAWHVWVRMAWGKHKLEIQVEDDGTGFSKIPEFIQRLRKKNNTLKLRSTVIGARINYLRGANGLLTKVHLKY